MVLQLEKAVQERAVELDSIRDENRRLHAQLQQAQTGAHTPPHSPPFLHVTSTILPASTNRHLALSCLQSVRLRVRRSAVWSRRW